MKDLFDMIDLPRKKTVYQPHDTLNARLFHARNAAEAALELAITPAQKRACQATVTATTDAFEFYRELLLSAITPSKQEVGSQSPSKSKRRPKK